MGSSVSRDEGGSRPLPAPGRALVDFPEQHAFGFPTLPPSCGLFFSILSGCDTEDCFREAPPVRGYFFCDGRVKDGKFVFTSACLRPRAVSGPFPLWSPAPCRRATFYSRHYRIRGPEAFCLICEGYQIKSGYYSWAIINGISLLQRLTAIF